MNEFDKATNCQLEALKMRQNIYQKDDEHPELANSYHQLALIKQRQGLFEEALPLHLKAHAIYTKKLQPDHIFLAISFYNLGTIQQGLSLTNEARESIQKAITIYEYRFPNGHPHIQKFKTTLNNL